MSAEVSDAEFRAAFSLLPHVLKLIRTLAMGQPDAHKIQKMVSHETVSPYTKEYDHITQVSDLQAQMQRCHQLLEATPTLSHTPEDQLAHLNRIKTQLHQKRSIETRRRSVYIHDVVSIFTLVFPSSQPSDLLLCYRDLAVLSTSVTTHTHH